MKHRILGLLAMTAMILVVFLASAFGPDSPTRRVHQHLTARQPDAGCDCDGSELCTHLPLVIIDTGGQEIPGKITGETDAFGEDISTLAPDGRDVINVSFTIVDNQDRNNHPSDTPTLSTTSEIRVRGHSSRLFEKSPYQLDFVDEHGQAAPAPVMGMASHSEWVLYGPYLDKSLVRNYMWYNIAGEAMEWAPNVRYCELIINGDYRGLYLMVETITDGEDCRLDLSTTAKNLKATGYLLQGDRTVEEDLGGERDIYSYLERMLTLSTDILIKYPKRSDLTEELRKEIEVEFAAFEKALYSYDYDTDDYGYWNYIDVDNFVNYFLINEFSLNVDAGRYSTYIYKDMSGKYKLAVWDFNNACDNYWSDPLSPDRIDMVSHTWFLMLCKSEDFVQRILDRYDELRQTVLSETYLLDYIDDTLAYLGPAVERNNQRWNEAMTQWEPLSPASRNLHSHEEAVTQLKEWLYERGIWLDENLHTIQQYCHPSRNKTYNH
ncbi:spore coat protein CotH [Pseudoflavonifractor sp. AF19-9AC]|uniref:CotH kinase family protein n=1 Tax=Pseudoflavonifractor sp. AF19-9AC TaxID=2292244 RepID=UPI000E4AF328|nr:CotH kinase family protein [Pseudoflavonifractor sp. AF19-9AC]RHR08070.1 spore coat protein CotH [Pseudoflavonifractor sp. AF19-9AC]